MKWWSLLRENRCSLWLKYGFLSEENLLILVNSIGATLFFCYVIVFWRFTINKQSTCRQLFSVVLVLGTTITYTEWYEDNRKEALEVMGKTIQCHPAPCDLKCSISFIQVICAAWLLWYFSRHPVACSCKWCAPRPPKVFHSHWFWCHFWFPSNGLRSASSSTIALFKFRIWPERSCRELNYFCFWSTRISDRMHIRRTEMFRTQSSKSYGSVHLTATKQSAGDECHFHGHCGNYDVLILIFARSCHRNVSYTLHKIKL